MEDVNDVISILKACLVVNQAPVLLTELNNLYKTEVGEAIPYKNLGFESLYSFVTDLAKKNIIKLSKNNSDTLIHYVSDEKVAHIESLIEKARPKTVRRRRRREGEYIANNGFNKFSRVGEKVNKNSSEPKAFVSSKEYMEENNVVVKKVLKSRENNFNWMRSAEVENLGTDGRGFPYNNLCTNELKNAACGSRNNIDGESYNMDQPLRRDLKLEQRETELEKFVCDKLDCIRNENEDKKMKRSVQLNINRSVTDFSEESKTVGNRNSTLLITISGDKRTVLAPHVSNKQTQLFPSVSQHILFGDDFFLQLAKYYYYDTLLEDDSLCFSLCKSGMTLLKAYQCLLSCKRIPSKVIVLCGATDIIRGVSINEMIHYFYMLLNDLCQFAESVVICTIPPLLQTSCELKRCHKVLVQFNEVILSVPQDIHDKIKVIDLFSLFSTRYNLLSHYDHKKELGWNEKGVKLALETIIDELS